MAALPHHGINDRYQESCTRPRHCQWQQIENLKNKTRHTCTKLKGNSVQSDRERDGLPRGFPEQPAPVPVKTRTRSHGPGF